MSEQTREATHSFDPGSGLWPCLNDPMPSSRHLNAILNNGSLSDDDKHGLLTSLDRRDPPLRGDQHEIRPIDRMRTRRRRSPWDVWFKNRSKWHGPDDDDDDPPPCPASARPIGPVPMDGNAGALAAA